MKIMSDALFNSQPEKTKKYLKKGYVFQEYLEGPTNKMALETCKKVAEHLGDIKHNPLFLYGASGLGKTHLLQAVGHAVLDKTPKARVIYMTSMQFIDEFIDALKHQNVSHFTDKFKSLDLLLIDNIQFLARTSAWLVDFSSTLDQILSDSKQTILTSDRYPSDIPEMESCLVDLLSDGLVIEIEPPELENRIDILLRKAKITAVDLPHDCAVFIANQVQGNVRELEGELNKVFMAARLCATEISIDLIKDVIQPYSNRRHKY
jgi:chromosomal replication initiator protein